MRGYRSGRERLTWGVIIGAAVGLLFFLYGQMGYSFAVNVLVNGAVAVAGTAAWLGWKHWGREKFPLPHKPSAE